MQVIEENSTITRKIQELCQSILAEPWFDSVQKRIDSFSQNPQARAQYEALNEKGEFLQHKQSQGVNITSEEIVEFEKLREAFFHNPVARGFLDAQEEMHKVQESVTRYVSMTFELGRLPAPEELSSHGGGCGSGCGCGH